MANTPGIQSPTYETVVAFGKPLFGKSKLVLYTLEGDEVATIFAYPEDILVSEGQILEPSTVITKW